MYLECNHHQGKYSPRKVCEEELCNVEEKLIDSWNIRNKRGENKVEKKEKKNKRCEKGEEEEKGGKEEKKNERERENMYIISNTLILDNGNGKIDNKIVIITTKTLERHLLLTHR